MLPGTFSFCTTDILPQPAAPHALCSSCPGQRPLRDALWQAAYYRGLHRRATQREAKLKARVRQLQAQIRDLRHRLFGRKSEARHSPDTPRRPKWQDEKA